MEKIYGNRQTQLPPGKAVLKNLPKDETRRAALHLKLASFHAAAANYFEGRARRLAGAAPYQGILITEACLQYQCCRQNAIFAKGEVRRQLSDRKEKARKKKKSAFAVAKVRDKLVKIAETADQHHQQSIAGAWRLQALSDRSQFMTTKVVLAAVSAIGLAWAAVAPTPVREFASLVGAFIDP